MKLPGSVPKAEPVWEAMAAELTPLGEPFRLNDREFKPGEWQDVTPGEAQVLQHRPWAQVRLKGAD